MKPPRTPDYVLLLQELREARAQSGMTQVQLAQALGQLQTYVSKCELGDRRLDVIELRAWASLEDRLARNSGFRSTSQVTSTPGRSTGGSRRRSPN
jgi:transcriptional regulator with XRE-family HTH domain